MFEVMQVRWMFFFVMVHFFVGIVYAQPADHDEFGCHITHQRIAGIKYTPGELAYARAALERSDTFDILEYRIHLTIKDFNIGRLVGYTDVDFRTLMADLDYLTLDLERLNVDSVIYNGQVISYTHEGPLLKLQFESAFAENDTASVRVYYAGSPMTSASGFGGFYFENGYAYNLGIGLRDKPHNYGRAWFPCFDNFVERSTYEYHITHGAEHMAYCVGTYLGTDTLQNGDLLTSYRMEQPIPTYLSSIAVSNYEHLEFNHIGEYGIVPVRLISRPGDLAKFESSFQYIGDAIDVFEKWYGPYPFERVGYVITTRGAMEHPTNVAYPGSAIADGVPDNRLMAHELCHHWWGNIVTLSTSHNMWIKEGPAEYGAHLFTEHVDGNEAFVRQIKTNAMNVMRRAHHDDGGFLALSPMPEDKTYGTHTYRKGAMMLHNLRGYLGDDLFSSGMKSILETYKYGNIDAYIMRDHLSQVTGIDLTNFYQDWIFQPGYPTFEVDSVSAAQVGQVYKLGFHIEQKLYGRDQNWFNQVPVRIKLMDENFEEIVSFTDHVTGQFHQAEFILDRIPRYVLLNPENTLNLGFQAEHLKVDAVDNYYMNGALMRFRYISGEGQAMVYAEHHFAGADDFVNNPDEVRIGKKRHWKVLAADIDDRIDYWAEVEYNANNGFDDDLTGMTEDSIILIWRPNASVEWREHPDYTKRRLAANDGQGFMRIFNLLPGDYAFANGEFLNTATKSVSIASRLSIFPNPVQDKLIIENPLNGQEASIHMYSMDGKLALMKKTLVNEDNQFEIDIRDIPSGTYHLELIDQGRGIIHQAKVVKN
jgi:hypothetical protein